MKNKTISIPDELFEMLKKEDNASDLITNLCYQYYKSLKPVIEEPVIVPLLDVVDKADLEYRYEKANDNLKAVLLSEISDVDIEKVFSNEEQ
jgi:hypothetical protein